MPTLIGALLDVSSSMKENAVVGYHGKLPWSRSIFEVIDKLVEHDVPADNHVLAVAFGAKKKGTNDLLDVIQTVQKVQKAKEVKDDLHDPRCYGGILDDVFRQLEENGAKRIRDWVKEEVVEKVVPKHRLALIAWHLTESNALAKEVAGCLPDVCKDDSYKNKNIDLVGIKFNIPFTGVLKSRSYKVASYAKTATEDDVKDVEKKALKAINRQSMVCTLNNSSIFQVQKAREVISGYSGTKELTSERTEELLESVKDFIYGGTPM